nr:uncharacterized protein LOC129163388 isoform X1 [Nothobranchius furzeri]
MIEDLKKDLMARQKDLESPTEYEELSDDELPSRNWSKAQRQIKPLIAENKRLKEDNFKHPIEAMKELPAVGQNLRDISELLSLISSSASARSTLVQTPVRTPARSELQLSAPASPQVDSADLVSLVSGESKSPDRSSTLCGLQVTQFTSETWQCSSTAGKRCPVTPPPPPPPPPLPHFPLVRSRRQSPKQGGQDFPLTSHLGQLFRGNSQSVPFPAEESLLRLHHTLHPTSLAPFTSGESKKCIEQKDKLNLRPSLLLQPNV